MRILLGLCLAASLVGCTSASTASLPAASTVSSRDPQDCLNAAPAGRVAPQSGTWCNPPPQPAPSGACAWCNDLAPSIINYERPCTSDGSNCLFTPILSTCIGLSNGWGCNHSAFCQGKYTVDNQQAPDFMRAAFSIGAWSASALSLAVENASIEAFVQSVTGLSKASIKLGGWGSQVANFLLNNTGGALSPTVAVGVLNTWDTRQQAELAAGCITRLTATP